MKVIFGLLMLIILIGCEKQIEEFDKFIFDLKQVSSKDIHQYEYDKNGRVKLVSTTNLVYKSGKLSASSTFYKKYDYNDIGQISRIFNSQDSTWQYNFYNEFDSLISENIINRYGDTIRLMKIEYIDGKVSQRKDRILTTRFSDSFKSIRNFNLRNYDTLFFTNQYVYEDDKHIKTLSFDKDERIIDEIEFVYVNNEVVKTISYSFFGDIKYIKDSTLFHNTETNNRDYLTIGNQGDTIGFKKTFFHNQGKTIVTYHKEINTQIISYFDKNGLEIGTVWLDNTVNTKTINSFKYDKKKNVIEESEYKERINNTH